MFRKINFIYALLIVTIIAGGVAYFLTKKEQNFIYSPDVSPKIQNEITRKQALEMVNNLPEVKDFIAQTENSHGNPQVAVSTQTDTDELGVYWTVQVYKNLSDHNSTFAWYQVYIKNGKIVNLSKDD